MRHPITIVVAVASWFWRQILDLYLTDRRLYNRLRAVTQRENIPVLPMRPEDRAHGVVVGKYRRDLRQISLTSEHFFNPWTLGHEIGHHIAVARGNDSEEAADHEGHLALQSVLSTTEYLAIAWRARLMLPLDPTVWAKRVVSRARKLRSIAEHEAANPHEAAVARSRLQELDVRHANSVLRKAVLHRVRVLIDQRSFVQRKQRKYPWRLIVATQVVGSLVLLSQGVFSGALFMLGFAFGGTFFGNKISEYFFAALDRHETRSRGGCFGAHDNCANTPPGARS